jgi:hypothetical protein
MALRPVARDVEPSCLEDECRSLYPNEMAKRQAIRWSGRTDPIDHGCMGVIWVETIQWGGEVGVVEQGGDLGEVRDLKGMSVLMTGVLRILAQYRERSRRFWWT